MTIAQTAAAKLREAQQNLQWSIHAKRNGLHFHALVRDIAELEVWQAQEALRQIDPANDCGERAA